MTSHLSFHLNPSLCQVERDAWDEARLRALCARHGWEFEWMTDREGPVELVDVSAQELYPSKRAQCTLCALGQVLNFT